MTVEQKYDVRSWPLSADDKRLFNVGSFGRSRNERPEARPLKGQSLIGLVHVAYDLRLRHDQREVLCDEVESSMGRWFVSYPDGSVFRHAEFATKHGKVNGVEIVRLLN